MTAIPIDYEILRLVWWLLLGVLLIGFAIMDGFDLGVAMLLPFVARTDIERRVTINAVGPFWDGNQVWLILGGGAIFAAWPPVYAASFSGFYIAMFLVLATLILRPVGFEFRNKVADARWRSFWDYALFAGGLVPSVVFGVAFALIAGWDLGAQYFAGYIVERSLSVDNLFVFVIIMSTFAVPADQQPRLLMIGIAGALVLRAAFIALGAAMLDAFSFTYLLFGLGLAVTYGIIQEHAGKIVVDSQIGSGTTFHLEFPAARKPVHV